MFRILATASILAVLNANPFLQITSSKTVNLSPAPLKNVINYVFVVANNSQWANSTTLNTALQKANGIFQQCQVSIGQVLIVYTNVSPALAKELDNQDPYAGVPGLSVGQKGLPNQWPIGFLVGKNVDQPGDGQLAFAMNLDAVVQSEQYGPSQPDERPILNTFWLSDEFISYTSTPYATSSFSLLAHEMTHVIGNLEHINVFGVPNLMDVTSHPASKSGALNAQQCQTILTYSKTYPTWAQASQ